MRSVALVLLFVGTAAALVHEFESDFPRPDDLFLYTIERSRREEAATTTPATTTTTTEATTTTNAVLSTTPTPSTTTTTLAPVATTVTTALPVITVTALPLNLVPQPALALPGAALGGYPSGLQLNHLGWAGQPYRLGVQSFPTGGYRFQHALLAPGAPATIARSYAPAVHYRPTAPLAPQFGAPYYGAVPFGAWQGRH
ncbi:hypothetical protein PRIPAC_81192 [Pristionchus pacificus]|uniref:Uncharacterized protein n=1 Tax=Pristionchus pacificus TaxID=54126 RepID=A0A2A6BXB8_PRIPA|nr:hypothetical protein PRIPAC_81192 [Pristionchus pacificus]|eukprot:PDM70506.1 hypothetical protein PRIPAC_46752 [Pristionchus pacificus]